MKDSTRRALEALKRILQDPATKQKLKSGKLWSAVMIAALGAMLTQLGMEMDLVDELASLITLLLDVLDPTRI